MRAVSNALRTVQKGTNSPARYFFEDFPGQWDETQLLAGEPGEYVNTARRSGENWYLGLICNEQRTAEFQLDFLGEGTIMPLSMRTARLWMTSPRALKRSTRTPF